LIASTVTGDKCPSLRKSLYAGPKSARNIWQILARARPDLQFWLRIIMTSTLMQRCATMRHCRGKCA